MIDSSYQSKSAPRGIALRRKGNSRFATRRRRRILQSRILITSAKQTYRLQATVKNELTFASSRYENGVAAAGMHTVQAPRARLCMRSKSDTILRGSTASQRILTVACGEVRNFCTIRALWKGPHSCLIFTAKHARRQVIPHRMEFFKEDAPTVHLRQGSGFRHCAVWVCRAVVHIH